MNFKFAGLTALVIALGPVSLLAGDERKWSWHEAYTEIYSPSFSKKGDELVIVRKKHMPDGHEAEELGQAEVEKKFAPIEKDERYADPEVVVLKIGSAAVESIGWGWSPQFSPDGRYVVFSHQKKPISRFRVLAATQAGNEIRMFDRSNKVTKTLATPTSGHLSDPIFAPDGKHVAYSLADATNGAWAGNVGIGCVSIDGSRNEILYPATKDFELFHLIASKKFAGNRLLALRSKPMSGRTYLAESYRRELLEIGPPEKSLYTWTSEETEGKSHAFATTEDGKVLIYAKGWRKLGSTLKGDGKLPAEDESIGLPSPDGRALAQVGEPGIKIRDLATLNIRKKIEVSGAIESIAWSPDSRRLAVILTRYQKGRGEVFDHDELVMYEL